MKKLVLLVSVLAGCASNSPPDRPQRPPLPEEVTTRPSASRENALTELLQNTVNAFQKSLDEAKK